MKHSLTCSDRFRRWQRSAAWLSVLLILFSAASCAGKSSMNADPLAYQNTSFRANIRGELAGAPFKAQVERIIPSDATGSPSLTVTFTAPAPLAGISLQQTENGATVSLDGMRIDASAWQDGAWFEIHKLFSLQGAPLSVTGREEQTVILETTDGETYTLIRTVGNPAPRSIEGDGVRIEILSFE